ncbi:MAG: protein translocase subunit SecF [Nanoarchaeota archaeon]|nr:protein translocase subunit SecF [Nanoarchaeota archaeon]MBU1622081.1 protein translocase subunit SecF [Nanoarchaeota archaeon]
MGFLSDLVKTLGQNYDKHYKKLLIIPTLLLFISIFLIAQKFATTGDFINRGVSLQGGITITIPNTNNIDSVTFQNYLQEKFPDKEINVINLKNKDMNGFVIDADFEEEQEINQLKQAIESKLKIKDTDYSEEIMGSSLGNSFFKQTFKAIIFAFLFMSGVVFLYFRIPTPSLAVVLAAFSDIITTLAIVNFLEIKISTAGIAAFLMLIGYSVDTDILLSTRVLKRKEGTVPERIRKAMSTGFMMTATTLGALIVGLSFAISEALNQIMLILLIGLLVDLIYTWLQNAVLLRMYTEKRNKNV